MKRIFTFLTLMLCFQLAKAQYPAFKTYNMGSGGTFSATLYGNIVPGPVCSPANYTTTYAVPSSPSLLVMAGTAAWTSPGATVINGFQFIEYVGGLPYAGPIISACGIIPGTYPYVISGGSAYHIIVEIETSPSCLKVRITP